MDIAYIALIVICVLMTLILAVKAKRKFRYILLNTLSGIGVMAAVCIVSMYVEVPFNLNPFTLIISAVGGTPGVGFLLALGYLL